jgi:dihydrofolate reductase
MVSLIVAKSRDVIGLDGRLPWSIPEETDLYRKVTNHRPKIVGRITAEGMPIRDKTIILSRRFPQIKYLDTCRTMEQAIGKAREYGGEIFVIGGGEVYAEFATTPTLWKLVNKLYVSEVKGDYRGDTFFPDLDLRGWMITRRETHEEFEHFVYCRRRDDIGYKKESSR